MTKLLTIAETAEALSASKSIVYQLLDRGDLPYVPVGASKAYRIDSRDLEQFIERRKVQNEAPQPAAPRPSTLRPTRQIADIPSETVPAASASSS